MTDDPLPSVDPDDPKLALREARQRFIADFSANLRVLSGLVRSARTDPDASIGALRRGAHRIAGLAGTVGFPALSAAASDLEAVCTTRRPAATSTRNRPIAWVAVMRGAFTEEITTVPSWAAIERRAEGEPSSWEPATT